MTPTMLDLLEDAARGSATIHFLPDEPDGRPMAELWRASGEAAGWLRNRAGDGGAVGAVLSSSFACLASMIGAWRAGLTVCSLPQRTRGMPPDEYRAQLQHMCGLVGAELVVGDAPVLDVLDDGPLAGVPFADVLAGRPQRGTTSEGRLVQFTSGSTSAPKGVELSLEALGANVCSILEALDVRPGDAACSWLPLSHDMGLVGMCLSGIAAAAPRWAGRGQLVLIQPETFLANPAMWLRACSTFGATITAAPNFALDLLARRLPRLDPLDLSRVRVCITGAEPVRAATLRSFTEAAEPHGFTPQAFCPAYGMAEAALAVTMVRPTETWQASWLQPGAGRESDTTAIPAASVELVGAGRPLTGMSVRIDDPGPSGFGEIAISGGSMMTGYVGAPAPWRQGGWFPTKDIGALIDGELYIAGRVDDVILSAGRNLYAADLELVVSGHASVRRGNCAAVPDEEGRYVVIAERRGRASAERLDQVGRDIRLALVRRFGVGPSAVVFIAPGSLPRTSSGKVRRSRAKSALMAGQLEIDRCVDFGSARPRASTIPNADQPRQSLERSAV